MFEGLSYLLFSMLCGQVGHNLAQLLLLHQHEVGLVPGGAEAVA